MVRKYQMKKSRKDLVEEQVCDEYDDLPDLEESVSTTKDNEDRKGNS